LLAVLETDAHLRLLAAQRRLDRCTDSTAPSYHVPNPHLDDPEER
jgi:hypothetical protein